jgi:hypothetical protein
MLVYFYICRWKSLPLSPREYLIPFFKKAFARKRKESHRREKEKKWVREQEWERVREKKILATRLTMTRTCWVAKRYLLISCPSCPIFNFVLQEKQDKDKKEEEEENEEVKEDEGVETSADFEGEMKDIEEEEEEDDKKEEDEER